MDGQKDGWTKGPKHGPMGRRTDLFIETWAAFTRYFWNVENNFIVVVVVVVAVGVIVVDDDDDDAHDTDDDNDNFFFSLCCFIL